MVAINDCFFKGRRLLLREIPTDQKVLLSDASIRRYPTMVVEGERAKCLRCGLRSVKTEVEISNSFESFYYCPGCIQLGRVQSNLFFYGMPDRKEGGKGQQVTMNWQGELTDHQKVISEKITKVILAGQSLMVHAVTGAGKTEMLFKGIQKALEKGWRIVIASPRIDVCLELYPRLERAFPDTSITLLHGQQEEPYKYSKLVIGTTHQLLRFKQAFDVVIVDEVDAFPYRGNAMLNYGVKKAKKMSGALIVLTATSTREFEQQIKKGKLQKISLAGRYHGYGLAVPKCLWTTGLFNLDRKGKLAKPLKKLLENQLNQDRRTLIFCPTRKSVRQLAMLIRSEFPLVKVGKADSKDPLRKEKVMKMRAGDYNFFVSSTILERGVTFVDIDVIVYGSHHPVFNQASLVQIAGRVGRSEQAPEGHVYFFHKGWTKAMRGALKEINQLNWQAKKSGVITK